MLRPPAGEFSAVRLNDQAFFGSLFLSRLADQILLFLVPLVVFQMTQSVAWSGLAFSLETLPRFLSFPICGILCDRVSPLRLLRVSQTCRAIACLAGMAGYAAFGGIGWLVGLSAVCGILSTQGMIAREVIMPQIFRQYRFEKVLSYSQIADQMGLVLGPVLAAALLGWWQWELVVAATAAVFLAADAALFLWRRMTRVELAEPEAAPGHFLDPLRTAFSHVLHLPGLKMAIVLAAGVNLVIGVTLATAPAMVTGIHGRGEDFFAGLQVAGAVATIVVLMTVAHVPIRHRTLGVMAYGGMFAGAVISGASPGFWGYVAGFLLVVGFDKMFNIYVRSLRQRIIPPKDFGKTTGVVIMLNNLTQPLAGFVVGLVTAPAQTGWVVAGIGLVMGLIGVTVAVVSPPRTA